MSFISLLAADDPALSYVATHVFFPPTVPRESDYTIQNDLALARAVCTAAHAYTTHIDDPLRPQWQSIENMLIHLQASVQFEHLNKDNVLAQLWSMQSGGTPFPSLLVPF